MEGERPQVFLVQQAGRVLVATLVAHVPQLLRRPQLGLHRIAPLSLLFLLLVISLHLSGILVSKKKRVFKICVSSPPPSSRRPEEELQVFYGSPPTPNWLISHPQLEERRPTGGDTPPLRRNWRRRNSEDGTVQRWPLVDLGQENSNWKLEVNHAGLLLMELQHNLCFRGRRALRQKQLTLNLQLLMVSIYLLYLVKLTGGRRRRKNPPYI